MLVVRKSKEEDKAFIYSTMLRGLYYGCDYFTSIDKQAFFANYPRVLDRLLDVADVSIACLADDEDVIVGFSITRPNIIDYCFVKTPFRKQGVAKLLLGGAVFSYTTHLTKPGAAIARKMELKHNPFML